MLTHVDQVLVFAVPGREHAPGSPVDLPLTETGVRSSKRRIRRVRRVEGQSPPVFPDLERDGVGERPAHLHVLRIEFLHLLTGLRHQQRHRLGQVGVEQFVDLVPRFEVGEPGRADPHGDNGGQDERGEACLQRAGYAGHAHGVGSGGMR